MGKKGFSPLESFARIVENLLAGHRVTVQSLVDALDVEEPAARSHFKRLAGIRGVVHERDGLKKVLRFPGMGWRRQAGPTDVAAACLMSSLASAFRETQLQLPIERIRADVIDSSKRARRAGDLGRRFWFAAGGGECALPGNQETLTDVIDAIIDTKRISFEYIHFSGKKDRQEDVEPLTLAMHEHQFYVIGRKAGGGYYPYRFSRMSSLTVDKATFEYPTPGQYDPARLFENVFGIYIAAQQPIEDVRIRISAAWRHYVESHRWHGTQTHVVEQSGEVVVHLKVRQSIELTRWVLWFGEDAEVLEPPSLREDVAKRLAAASLKYAAPKKRGMRSPGSAGKRAGKKRGLRRPTR